MFNLGRILTGLATLAAVLIGAALGVPALMDWNHLRAPVEARAEALLGAPVRVDGRITAQLLPSPALSLGNVVVEKRPGLGVSGDFGRVRVHLALRSLLFGKAVPAALSVSGADLLVDRAALAQGAGIAKLGLPLNMKDGIARFEAGGAADLSGLGGHVRPGRGGEFRFRLSGTFENTPFRFRAVKSGGGPSAWRSAVLDFGEGQAVLSVNRAGNSTEEGKEIRFKLTRAEKAAAFFARLIPGAGRFIKPEQVAGLAPLTLAVRTVPDGESTALRDVEVTAGPLRLVGEGRYRPGERPVLQLDLGARTMVLGGDGNGLGPSGLLRMLGRIAEWGSHFDGSLRLYADHVLAGGAVIRQSELRLGFGPQGTRLERFKIALPRGLVLSGQGVAAGQGRLAATVRVDGAHLEDWIAGPGTRPPRGRAGTPLTMEGRLTLSGSRAALEDVQLTAGRNKVRAEGILSFGKRTELEMRAEADELDLRPYGLAYEDVAAQVSLSDLWGRIRKLAAQADITARIELGSVRLTDKDFRDGILDLALDDDQVVLRRLSVEEAGGQVIEARLRAPLVVGTPGGEADAGNGSVWTEQAEAAIEVRGAREAENGIAWRAGLWDGMLSLETGAPLRSRLSGRFKQKDDGFQWSDVSGRIGKASIAGELTYVPGARPLLRGIVRAERAVITLPGGNDENLWPGWALERFWPRGLDIHLDWSADDLTVAGAAVTDARGTAVLEEGTARLVLVSGTLYGGAAAGSASLALGTDGIAAWESQGVVQRADLAVLMGGGWQGRGIIRQSTSGSGASISRIVSGLRGTLSVNFQEGRLGGIDAAALAAALPELDSAAAVAKAVDQALGRGATSFRRLEGEARIGNGEVVLSGISAQTEQGPVMLAGVVSLPARLIAMRADISLGDKIGAPLSVQFIGRMEAPERMADTERLAKRLMQ